MNRVPYPADETVCLTRLPFASVPLSERKKPEMRIIAAFFLIASMLACGPLAVQPTSTPVSGPDLVPPTLTLTPAPPPTATVAPIELPPPRPPLPTPTPDQPWLPGDVYVYPGPLHYAGDLITVEVPVQNIDLLPRDELAALTLDGNLLPIQPVVAYSPLRTHVLVFRWAWDTTGVTGRHRLAVTLPDNAHHPTSQLEVTVDILPAEQRPGYEREATWQQRDTLCCRLYYVSNTAAARDIALIAAAAEEAAAAVKQELGLPLPNTPVPIIFLDNVWGNGGYVADAVVITYVDRSYVMPDLASTLRHELTHWASSALTPSGVASVLSEGLAVYASGGHYKPEPLPERAAALVELGVYVPLIRLADNFWAEQHEIAYMEAGALVTYLVETYGLDAFKQLYAVEVPEAPSESSWLDQAMRRVYGVGLAQVEQSFLAWLSEHPPGVQIDDVRLTVALYDTVRRYQALYARYQESLPPLADAIERGQVAEFTREPTDVENIALETLLISAQQALVTSQYTQAQALIDAVEAVLGDGDFTRDIVGDYTAITRTMAAAGYEVQAIALDGDRAIVSAIQDWPQMKTFTLTFDGTQWQVAN